MTNRAKLNINSLNCNKKKLCSKYIKGCIRSFQNLKRVYINMTLSNDSYTTSL